MKLFVTSSPGGSACVNGTWGPAPFDRANGFLDRFKEACKGAKECLLISSDPNHTEMNDAMRDFYGEAFAHSHMGISKVDVCDRRNAFACMEHLHDYDILILAGGHVPTQMAFFEQIRLRDHIQSYQGVVVGISAGSMNCARTVYAAPEEPGEAIDPDYQRYIPGLGLTSISILPHFQEIRHFSLDGLRMVQDICVPDSKVRPFYAIPDGTYFYRENGKTTLYGEAWYFDKGNCLKICRYGKSVEVDDE